MTSHRSWTDRHAVFLALDLVSETHVPLGFDSLDLCRRFVELPGCQGEAKDTTSTASSAD